MHEQKKNKNRAVIALALCFCVMALTSFLAVKSSLDKINNSGMEVVQEQTTDTGNTEAAAKTPVVDSQDKNSPQSDDTAPRETAQQADYIAPLDGSIQLEYSMDSLVYSKTLDQYMTHPGVDITADLSTEVKSIADGIITKVYSDDRYGITVCVSHGDGIISIYSNLAEQGLAETGDEVTQGQTIGCVGDTALFESLESTHLHFEMTKDENNVDPGEYIDALKKADS